MFLHGAAFKHLIPQLVLVLDVAQMHMQDVSLGLVEPHEVHMGTLFGFVQVPLNCILSLKPTGVITSTFICLQ